MSVAVQASTGSAESGSCPPMELAISQMTNQTKVMPGACTRRRSRTSAALRGALSGNHGVRRRCHVLRTELREIVGDYQAVFSGAAADTVRERISLARAAGFDASGEALESGSGVWPALAQVAEGCGAAVVVCGSRGRGAGASTLLGSVSSGLVHNSETPNLVV